MEDGEKISIELCQDPSNLPTESFDSCESFSGLKDFPVVYINHKSEFDFDSLPSQSQPNIQPPNPVETDHAKNINSTKVPTQLNLFTSDMVTTDPYEINHNKPQKRCCCYNLFCCSKNKE